MHFIYYQSSYTLIYLVDIVWMFLAALIVLFYILLINNVTDL